MQIVQDDRWFKVARITGPTHHYLGVRFGSEPLNDSCQIAADVCAGVSQANAELGTAYQVAAIQLAEGDEYNQRVYMMLGYEITKFAATHGV